LRRQTAFPEKVTASQNRNHGFPAGSVDDRELHAALLNIHNRTGGIALRENAGFFRKLHDSSGDTGGIQEFLGVEKEFLGFHAGGYGRQDNKSYHFSTDIQWK
jgi:hypothetical protein